MRSMVSLPRAVDTEATDSRLCCGCGHAFRPRTASRRSRCLKCAAAYMRGYRAAKRADRLDDFARQIRRQRTTAGVLSTTAQLVDAMREGGALAQAFAAHVHSLPPGSARAASFWNAILRLVECCPAPRLDQLDDATLNEAVRQGDLSQ
jgi:hypothetical protein